MLNCCKHNLWRAFVGGIIDTDEKVAYNLVTNNCSQFKKGVKTMDILFMTKMARIETKTAKNLALWGFTSL